MILSPREVDESHSCVVADPVVRRRIHDMTETVQAATEV